MRRPARRPRVSAKSMNSLSYLSRQFDVLASAAIPATPPSTPTGEARSFIGDAHKSSPTMRRIQTWTSAFFPTAEQARPELVQRRLVPPPVRSRRRSGSTPNSRRYQPGVPTYSNQPAPTSFSRDGPQASGSVEPMPTLAPAAEIFPSIPRNSRNTERVTPVIPSELSYARKAMLRVLLLLSGWFGTLWQGLVHSLQYTPRRRVFLTRLHELEVEQDTTDEKDSDEDLPAALESRLRVVSNDKNRSKRTRTSSLLEYVLQPHFKPPTPSPLGKTPVVPTPTLAVIPPDGTDMDSVPPTSPGAEDSSSSGSTLRLPTPPSSHGSQTSSSPARPTRVTPLHTKKTLVLDLDETLIHSTTRPLNSSTGNSGMFSFGSLIGRNKKAGHMVEVYLNGRSTLYHVYKRPFVDYFLRKVSAWYTLVIFTASMKEYADPVIDWLDAGRGMFSHRLFREHCKQLPNGSYSKDLSILEEDLARVCLIDNSPVSYSINQANGIPIEGWTHDPFDEALLDLLPVLDSLRFTSDVRHILGLRGF